LAEHGNAAAQAVLARIYAEGRGIERDPVEAYVLYEQAARGTPIASEREKAKAAAAEIAAGLSPDLRAYAMKRADDWQPKAP
jgi:hypothetical protein